MTEQAVVAEKAVGKVYEVAYLVSPIMPEEKVGEVVSRIKAVLEKQSAFVLSEEFPRLKQLAYTLVKSLGGKNEKYTSAFFGWIKFDGSILKLNEVSAALEHDGDIVRFLIVKTDRERKVFVRAPLWRRDTPKRDAVVKHEEKKVPSMTEAELDKTIEELIAE